MELDDEKIQELIAGYAVGALDETEIAEAAQLLRTSEEARQLLAEFQEVTAGLALSVEPVELPEGSLERLRLKAGFEATLAPQPAPAPRPLSQPVALQPKIARKAFWATPTFAAMAATLVLFVTTAVFAGLWLNASNKLDQATQNQQALAQILAAPDLKTVALQSTNSTAQGNVRVYADPATNKVYLFAQDMPTLSSDKEYEAWLITADNQPHAAGLMGTGANTGNGVVFELTPSVPLDQYKVVALTVEHKGGAAKPTSPPVLAGNLNG
jgi:anti-sigma-K factor RskA